MGPATEADGKALKKGFNLNNKQASQSGQSSPTQVKL